MKRFRFPLQSVTTVRAWRESEAREAFGARLRALAQADDAVLQARERLAQIETQLRAGRATTFRPAEQAAFLASHQREQLALARAEKARHEARQAVDEAREQWQGRRGELRAVEQLEQRARQAHRLNEERAEQAAMDELASIRSTRLSPVRS